LAVKQIAGDRITEMKRMRTGAAAMVACIVLLTVTGAASSGVAGARDIVLATTTSTQDTGLLDALIPPFEKQTGIRVKVIAVGTGQALALGRRGDADLLLVHAPDAEKRFMAEGYGADRRPLMFNDFVIVGPADDPAKIRGTRSPSQALARIAKAGAVFASRGDNSGTHMKEKDLWALAHVNPAGAWYLEAGSGMAAVLRLASERGAYTLSDRGTFLAQKGGQGGPGLALEVLCEGAPVLRNPYAVITLNPQRFPDRNTAGARRFADYLLSPEAQRIIAGFGKEKFGQPLFHLYPSPKSAKGR
jgi:tungstate transport system substrate-binding protein